jgi:nitrogen regulatory protein P-II 1
MRGQMKKIEASIRSSKLGAVEKALAVACGGDPGYVEPPRVLRRRSPRDREPEMLKLDLVVADEVVAGVLEAIFDAARTGGRGDGWILVVPVDEAVRIPTGKRGEEAA